MSKLGLIDTEGRTMMQAIMFEEQRETVALGKVDDFIVGLTLGIAIAGLFFC
jgi:hypothetical protein